MTEPRFFYKNHTFAVAAIATATNRSIQNQLHQPSLFPLISGQNVGEMIRSAWQIEIKMMHCSVFLRIHFLHMCSQCHHLFGEKYSDSLKMLGVTQPWWMYLNLKIYDHNPVICSVRMIIPAVLQDQHKNCWTRKLFVRNYTKKMFGSEFETQLFAAALAAPLSSFPCCPNKMRYRFLFCQRVTGRNFLYLTYFLYFTAVSMQ